MNTSDKSHLKQIDIDTSHDIFSTIRALDTGITNHESWINHVHQSLICQSHTPNPDDLCDDAHCRCKFGKWLYSSETEQLKQNELFHSIVNKHQNMHALARDILQKGSSQQNIDEDEYCEFTSQVMAFKLEVRNLQYDLMSQVCIVDHLTGAWNRYAMHSKLNQEKERMLRTGHTSVICMMDIDHFKLINDNHGHNVGDSVLKTVIEFCRANLRKYDTIYRYGGEEFLFFLPDTQQEEAKIIIERLCIDLAKHPTPLASGDNLTVTASFGIACMDEKNSVEDSIQLADHALLFAKAQGRNQVCCWENGLNAF